MQAPQDPNSLEYRAWLFDKLGIPASQRPPMSQAGPEKRYQPVPGSSVEQESSPAAQVESETENFEIYVNQCFDIS